MGSGNSSPKKLEPGMVASHRDLADKDSQFFSFENVEIHYKYFKGETENLPTIVLCHGFFASVESFRNIQTPLQKYFNVLSFDRPAFGLTQRVIKKV
jgi:pimeloyl-ACP methyl ester carboxylesterase